ncbi:unnamed protein product [Anisakis simplex]|uniref:Reelin domain-containing protein n=1 Tax=Anisakis simplex TaxID=6269 RepID=A0A0M3JTI4_ANISI|nr:unnamed protein product [Anisakis simplex]
MSVTGIITGRARVVYSCPEFLHLSKGGLDGKIVAYRDSWISKNFDIQDWVTFKAKAHEPEGTHVTFGVRYKALPNSVQFESKGKIVDGIGTLMKVDEAKGQYGFITANNGSTVYFTASVVRPDTKDIRTVFKPGMQIRYRATEQKQNQVQWRAIAVCHKNASIDILTGRQPKSIDAVTGNRYTRYLTYNLDSNFRTVIGLTPKKPLQPTVTSNNNAAPLPAPIAPPSPGGVHSSLSLSLSGSVISNSVGSRSSSGSRSGTPGGGFGGSASPLPYLNSNGHDAPDPPSPSSRFGSSNSLDMPQVVFPTSLPPTQAAIPFHEVPTTGDAYEDAVRRLAYFAHCISESSCNYCLFR